MTREEILEEIDRERKWLDEAGYTVCNIDIVFSSIYKNIKALEQEPKTGRWIGPRKIGFGEWENYGISLKDGFLTDDCHCSECGEEMERGERGIYCPKCGCQMKSEG